MRHRSAAAVLGALAACHPGSIETLADTELVLTRFSPDVFGEDGDGSSPYRTYARPDIVAPLDPDEEGPPREPEPPELNDEILEAIDRNLEALGYERLVDEEAPSADLFVLAGLTTARWNGWVCFPGWPSWGWWGGWRQPVGPGSRWCFPGGPGSVTFERGSLLIDFVDASEIDEEREDLPVVWSAAIQGLLSSTTDGVLLQIDRTVNRAFSQSAAYLRSREVP